MPRRIGNAFLILRGIKFYILMYMFVFLFRIWSLFDDKKLNRIMGSCAYILVVNFPGSSMKKLFDHFVATLSNAVALRPFGFMTVLWHSIAF